MRFRGTLSAMKRQRFGWGFLVLLALGGSGCDDGSCRRNSDCESPELCVEQQCSILYCDPTDPICPEDSFCLNGWCHAGESDAGPDAANGDGDLVPDRDR